MGRNQDLTSTRCDEGTRCTLPGSAFFGARFVSRGSFQHPHRADGCGFKRSSILRKTSYAGDIEGLGSASQAEPSRPGSTVPLILRNAVEQFGANQDALRIAPSLQLSQDT